MTGSASSSSKVEAPALEARLGHTFADKSLLEQALRHASAGTVSNERLEFLGDRVLGLIVAEKLYALFQGDPEGLLAVKLNALVRKEACAQAAEAAGLSKDLVLAHSEARAGGRQKAVILAGACEAVIAALYLDGGMEAARAFIARYWTEMFGALDRDMRDAKTALQEWAQSGPAKTTPLYRLLKREGPDHAPKFVVEVSAGDQQPAMGEGRSKREAEQAAAQAMLARLGLWQS
ncbi:MAG TPA: ribonuclease III [Rhizomicrobium sp.]|nr:ribonuclease III [Rhizomicrobium sp.]